MHIRKGRMTSHLEVYVDSSPRDQNLGSWSPLQVYRVHSEEGIRYINKLPFFH